MIKLTKEREVDPYLWVHPVGSFQFPLFPMRVFARRIKNPLDVFVQRPQHGAP
jgi:hypothetical protein